MLPEQVRLDGILKDIPSAKVSAFVYRLVPLKYTNSVESTEGSRLWGGRFNPPVNLAEKACGIVGGFGYLYTATNPITCLFECGHILRGLRPDESQMIPTDPTLLVSFKVESDKALDLCDPRNQAVLGLNSTDLTTIDDRADLNEAGLLTPLQQLGISAYCSGRFAGIVAPSRFTDIVPSYCFNFLPKEVKSIVLDSAGILDRVKIVEH